MSKKKNQSAADEEPDSGFEYIWNLSPYHAAVSGENLPELDVSGFAFGAMENKGLNIFGDAALQAAFGDAADVPAPAAPDARAVASAFRRGLSRPVRALHPAKFR